MTGFSDVLGHEQTILHMKHAIEMDKVSHAYIISGEKGSGKKLLADLFARTLQCERKGTEPCMECQSCKQALSLNQPDIIRVMHEKPNTISVEDIRTQINGDIMIRPYSSPYKIYIVDEAEKLSVQAQNALLKTIEEPPVYAVLLLLTTNAGMLLQTIRSRCVILELKPVSSPMVKNYLMEQLEVPEYHADICTAFAQGNVGKAKRLALSDSFSEMLEHALHLVKYIHDMEVVDMISDLKRINTYKMEINDYLDLLTVWYRDVLMFKATRDADSLIFSHELISIREKAQKSSYEGLECIIKSLEKAKIRLNANVNFDMALELLLLTMKEN
ncbi:MAG: DNA polymerase III subunit delta [Lachnospiraceae bacterium]|jgi:DNA polymerase-3 subunit delta'|nr:DNA polymerase III subunit [Lachnospiraceae bacterium]MCI9601782.1 DNA polymerase III subunit [Lachnospiraceae bacterium]MDE6896976.1 DNA polymerase III subunit delta [Lachnospiraceae bacterium]